MESQVPVSFFGSGRPGSLHGLTVFGGLLLLLDPIYKKLNLFFPVTLSHVNLIIRPAEEPRKGRIRRFPPLRLFISFFIFFNYEFSAFQQRFSCVII